MVRRRLLFVGAITIAALCAAAGAGRDPDRRRRPDDRRSNAWFGEQYERGAELAVADLNAEGGVLGQTSS